MQQITELLTDIQTIPLSLHGAASGSSSVICGELCNVIHLKQKKANESEIKYESSLLFDRVLFGQYGTNFGMPGDSGGLVSIETSTGQRHIVGVFVGACDSKKSKFVATPAEVIQCAGYTFCNN
eukprot:scaffold4380_cov181-Ochromonas_danica.AAC.3